MARISGVDLPREKRVEIGLTYIYGIGLTSSKRILTEAGVNPDTRCKDLTDDEVKKISDVIDASQTVEGDLRREIALNIKRLQEIGCYRFSTVLYCAPAQNAGALFVATCQEIWRNVDSQQGM